MLREINPFAQSDLQMYRLVQEHSTTSVKMVFLEDKNLDMRRYNAPTLCTEVAAIFVGNPRHMQQNYQDAMAMVRKFGKPDLFLTFTCNPSWSEILNSLEGVQRPEDRPDIIRGLPHAHILLTLDSENKIRTKDDIDKFVSAELPDPCTDLRLFQIVTECMVHGSCGTININSPCMRDGQCYKSFPKQFKDDTEENVNGYPIYRRRATEPVQVGKYSIDNRWVVPYNTWLLKKFNAHINVEVCASVKSVKYLYKYVYKGHDAASVKIPKRRCSGS
ncbi:hypothetical protein AVEN_219552-1 [Araneus ventricosus]|uniref:Helitron helicase-like domain-containing protein n=1 Tax=Araneus ventricosus TaxID=182803 RepID=A0A4Y2SDA5_ARAVE|nr:hypothetical protein AVEN_219552-1 [Araneus ventricosus]